MSKEEKGKPYCDWCGHYVEESAIKNGKHAACGRELEYLGSNINFGLQNIIVIEESDKDIFETKVNKYLLEGYKILSTNCAAIEMYEEMCRIYQAILYKE